MMGSVMVLDKKESLLQVQDEEFNILIIGNQVVTHTILGAYSEV